MRVVVVGAGISGLLAAARLQHLGHDVVVFDKGRGPGGRLATRRIGGATLDHGAQFFTVRSEEFDALTQPWITTGLVVEWCRGFGGSPDGYPRYVVRGGMNALAKHVAAGLDVRCATLVFAVHRGAAGGWQVRLDDGAMIAADAVVLTCPLPQSYSLLVTAEIEVPEALWRTDYDRTLALLAVLDGPGGVPVPGGVQGAGGFTFIGDNKQKGVSAVPALTLHADPMWSAAHWDDPSDEARRALCVAAAPWLGAARIVDSQLKRWRFATPRVIWPERMWQDDDGRLVLAGDAFCGPRVEGAALSGLAAALAVHDGDK